MRKLILGLLLSTSAFGAGFGKSCLEFQDENIEVLKITKTYNRANELVIRLAVDHKNCRFLDLEKPLQIYWEMGKKIFNGKIPCERLLLKEVRDLLGYNDLKDMYQRAVLSASGSQIKISMPAFSGIPDRVGSKEKLSDIITFKISKSSTGCKTKAFIRLNNNNLEVDRIHNVISFLSLKRIDLFNDSVRLHTIK